MINRILQLISLSLLLSLQFSLHAQDFLSGKLTDSKSKEQAIYYDRTQNLLAKNSYQTLYKVFDAKKNLIKTVSVIHDRAKSLISISTKSQGLTSSVNVIKYERSKSGLVLSNQGNLDSVFNLSPGYTYLLSFGDTLRDYPVLHQVKTAEGDEITMDPITKLRLRKHIELSRNIVNNDPTLRKEAEDKEVTNKKQRELFNTRLLKLRDSLYSLNTLLAGKIMQDRKKIDSDIATLFKSKKVYPDAKRYEGGKKEGKASGEGLFMSNGNYYDGYFADGKFVSGIVVIHYDAYEYCGDYSLDSLNGIGLLKFTNESYMLGTFKEGTVEEGVAFSLGKTGEVYFGMVKDGARTGYGELYNTKGEMYYGEFLGGRLVKGYSKDSDPFGFFSYSKIETGLKTPVETPIGEAFFNPLVRAKP
jgi:hypothetical protein